MRWNSPDGSELMLASRGLESLYQSCGAAATDRSGIHLHGRGWHPGGGQRGGHRLGAGQTESEGGRLGGRVVRGGIAVAGNRDDAVPATRGKLLQGIGGKSLQLSGAGNKRHADG